MPFVSVWIYRWSWSCSSIYHFHQIEQWWSGVVSNTEFSEYTQKTWWFIYGYGCFFRTRLDRWSNSNFFQFFTCFFFFFWYYFYHNLLNFSVFCNLGHNLCKLFCCLPFHRSQPSKFNAWAFIEISVLTFYTICETSCETILWWDTDPHLLTYHTLAVFEEFKQNRKKYKRNNPHRDLLPSKICLLKTFCIYTLLCTKKQVPCNSTT